MDGRLADPSDGPLRAVVLGVLVLTMAGCFGFGGPHVEATVSFPITREGPAAEAVASAPASPSGEGAPSAANSDSLEPPTLEVRPSHSSAIVYYNLSAPIEHITIGYRQPGMTETLVEANATAGAHQVRLGFLRSEQTYDYEVRVSHGSRAGTTSGSFRTTTNPHHWATEKPRVQPGTSLYGCALVDEAPNGLAPGRLPYTAGFVLQSWDNESVYLVTAGHCGLQTGQRVSDLLGEFGTVVARSGTGFPEESLNEETNAKDWSLVALDGPQRPLVSPRMIDFTGPAGPSQAHAMQAGDKVCYHGQGLWPEHPAMPASRCGDFVGFKGGPGYGLAHVFDGDVGLGDSGMPVLDYKTGTALGIFTGSNGDRTRGYGIPLFVLLEHLHGLGFDLQVSTAPYTPAGLP